MTRAYTLRQRAVSLERSRAAILVAARRELARATFAGLRVDAVAHRARCSPRTVYAHFPTRAALAEAALRERAESLALRVARWRPRSADPASVLDEVVAFHERTYRQEHALLEILLDGAPPVSGRAMLRGLDAERLRVIARTTHELGARAALRVRAADAAALIHATLAYPAWRVALTGPARRRAPRLLAAALRAALLVP